MKNRSAIKSRLTLENVYFYSFLLVTSLPSPTRLMRRWLLAEDPLHDPV